jgi:hypothetical protein
MSKEEKLIDSGWVLILNYFYFNQKNHLNKKLKKNFFLYLVILNLKLTILKSLYLKKLL